MILRALLATIVAFCVLFIWRLGRQYPNLTTIAAVVAAVAGIFLFRHPVLVIVGLICLGGLIFWPNAPRR